MITMLRTLAASLAVLAFSVTAFAQVSTGRVDARVHDATGHALSGVRVEFDGPLIVAQMTDAGGEAHFLALPPGIYAAKATMNGFRVYTNDVVQVSAGAQTALTVSMIAAAEPEASAVPPALPIADAMRQSTTTNISVDELQNTPNARDPWVVMQTVPTISVDRVNIGGSTASRQSVFIGKGAPSSDNTWNIDGIPITDMGAAGTSPTFFAIDMLQELSVTTGGADPANATPGVQVNVVLRKGANTAHGSASTYFENQSLQGTNIPIELSPSLGGFGGKGNRTDRYLDSGFELGGPVFKDRLFAWGSLTHRNVRELSISNQLDEATLNNAALKADGNLLPGIRGNFAIFRGTRTNDAAGFGSTRSQQSAWTETAPMTMYKGEANFNPIGQFFAAVRYAHIVNTRAQTPNGGNFNFYIDDQGVAQSSYFTRTSNRPQHYASGDASYFAGPNELKVGFAWRRTPVQSSSQVPGNQIYTIWNTYPNMIARAQRPYANNTVGEYINGYAADTISLDRLTVMAAVRFNRQASSYQQTVSSAVPGIALLPQLTAPAVQDAFVFKTVEPRIGLTLAIDESRKTIARASYARFASQLPGNAAAFLSPFQPATYVSYNIIDRQTTGAPCVTFGTNGCDGVASLSEIQLGTLAGTQNVNVGNPGQVSSPNIIGSLTPPKTNELMFGVDHEAMPNLGVSATFTYRRMDDFLWNPGIGVQSSSYAQTGTLTGTLPNGATVSVPYYAPPLTAGPGRIAENRPNYYQRYISLEIAATKRLADHWMARVAFASTSWNEYFNGPGAILDPTPTPATSASFANYIAGGPNVGGGPVVVASPDGSPSGVYMLPSKYFFTAKGLYQARWGVDLGANFMLRQGYSEPFFRSLVSTGDPLVPAKTLLLTQGADQFRLDAVSTLDIRVEKKFTFGFANFAVDFDVFNVLNKATTLGVQYDARQSNYGQALEIMNPRIARLGVRMTF